MYKHTSIKYKVERDERYLPYIELGHWLCSHFQLETPSEFSQADNSKIIQPREINLTSLDSLGSCESIYIHHVYLNRQKHELNHFKDNRNTILDLF